MNLAVRTILLIAVWLGAAGFSHAAEVLRLATTTSTVNSGLMSKLMPVFEDKHQVSVHTIVGGTGRALNHAKNGDVDVILVHAKEAELELVANGYGVNRQEIMYNDFVIVGPKNDPAGISGSNDLTAAFAGIASVQSNFISRGDDSGTHKKELKIWERLGITDFGSWYKSVGSGMGRALQIADELDAYILTDKGTWLFLKDRLNMSIHVESAADGRNVYGVIAVNPEKHPQVNFDAAQKLITWLTSIEAKSIISNYRVNGEQLFFALK